MSGERQIISARLTQDQYDLFRRRLFIEDKTIQSVIAALVNAYILGDVSVTHDGRYHLSPPSSHDPVIEVEKKDIVIEIEPDWGIGSTRPQVGADNHRQKPRKKEDWGTRELAHYLRKATERRVSLQSLRRLLNAMDIEKDDNGRWSFDGPEDREVVRIAEAIQSGLYDTVIQDGVAAARQRQEELDELATEHYESVTQAEEDKRVQHLKRLRSIQRGKD